MEETFKKILNETLNPLFKKAGYLKKNLNFFKHEGDMIFMFNLQRSAGNYYGEIAFYINCGIHSKAVDAQINGRHWDDLKSCPKEYQCHYRKRLEPTSQADFGRFIINAKADIDHLKKDLEQLLTDALVFYSQFDTHEKLISYLCKNGTLSEDEILRYCLRNNLETDANALADSMRNTFEKLDERWLERIKPRLQEIVKDEKPTFSIKALE